MVGINNETPTEALDVAGNILVSGTLTSAGFKMTDSPTEGYVLKSDADGNGTWQAASGGGASTLGALDDVTLTSSATGQLLGYNGTAWVNTALDISGAGLGDLGDVTLTTETDGQFLGYNGTAWVNADLDISGFTLGDIGDVDLTTAATDGQVLNGTTHPRHGYPPPTQPQRAAHPIGHSMSM